MIARTFSRLPLLFAFLVLLMSSCKKDKDETSDPNAIKPTHFRITATINAPGMEPTDVYRVVGNFLRPNHYNIAGAYTMKKQNDGIYRIDISREEMVDPPERLTYSISRNGQFMELDANCQPVASNKRTIAVTSNLGKEIKITVEGFEKTGNCP